QGGVQVRRAGAGGAPDRGPEVEGPADHQVGLAAVAVGAGGGGLAAGPAVGGVAAGVRGDQEAGRGGGGGGGGGGGAGWGGGGVAAAGGEGGDAAGRDRLHLREGGWGAAGVAGRARGP